MKTLRIKWILLLSLFITLTCITCWNDKKNQLHKSKGELIKPNPPIFGWIQNKSKKDQRSKIIPEDSLFVYHGISNTEIIEKMDWDFGYLFVDSTKKKSFLKLDNKSKIELLSDITKFDTTWIKEDIQAYIISKQEKIGNIQPMIISASGTDYVALILLTLDNQENIISKMYLDVYVGSGPRIDYDSIMLLEPFTRCFFEKNKILSYSLNVWVNKYKNIPATIDSISYQSLIDLDGNIKTIKLDSVRYKRNYNW